MNKQEVDKLFTINKNHRCFISNDELKKIHNSSKMNITFKHFKKLLQEKGANEYRTSNVRGLMGLHVSSEQLNYDLPFHPCG